MRNLTAEQLAGANSLYWLYSFDYFLTSMEKLGVSCIDLYTLACHGIDLMQMTAADLRALHRRMRARGVRAGCVLHDTGAGFPNIASENEAVRQRSIRLYRRMVEAAVELEAPKIQLLPGRCGMDLPPEVGWMRAADSLYHISRAAEREGVRVVVEASSYHNTTVGRSTRQVLRLLDQVRSPMLQTMLDICSVYKLGETFEESLRAIGRARMGHVHLCDGTPMGHLVPGDGNLPVVDCLRALDAFGYRDTLALEIFNERYERDPHTHMQRALAFFRAALA